MFKPDDRTPEDPAHGRMTARDALAALRRRLAARGGDEARSLSEWTLARAMGCRRVDLPRFADRRLDAAQARRLDEWSARLEAGEPLQYVLGDAEFFGRVFRCDARALIPRPETEELVAAVLAEASLWARPSPRVVDVGTGTGCIAVTLAVERPAARVAATDRSAAALALARENARLHGVGDRIAWRLGDLLAGEGDASADAVVANLPYVPTAELARLEGVVREHEPADALDGGPDGLSLIRRAIPQAARALAPGGLLMLEIGGEQGAAVGRLLRAAGFTDVQIRRDLAGHERLARAVAG